MAELTQLLTLSRTDRSVSGVVEETLADSHRSKQSWKGCALTSYVFPIFCYQGGWSKRRLNCYVWISGMVAEHMFCRAVELLKAKEPVKCRFLLSVSSS